MPSRAALNTTFLNSRPVAAMVASLASLLASPAHSHPQHSHGRPHCPLDPGVCLAPSLQSSPRAEHLTVAATLVAERRCTAVTLSRRGSSTRPSARWRGRWEAARHLLPIGGEPAEGRGTRLSSTPAARWWEALLLLRW